MEQTASLQHVMEETKPTCMFAPRMVNVLALTHVNVFRTTMGLSVSILTVLKSVVTTVRCALDMDHASITISAYVLADLGVQIAVTLSALVCLVVIRMFVQDMETVRAQILASVLLDLLAQTAPLLIVRNVSQF